MSYPTDKEITVKWTKTHIVLLVLSTILVWGTYLLWAPSSGAHPLVVVTVLGLYLDIFGVVIASLKTPFYGHFLDGGQIEVKRLDVERRYFQVGMFMVGVGFFLQAVGAMFAK